MCLQKALKSMGVQIPPVLDSGDKIPVNFVGFSDPNPRFLSRRKRREERQKEIRKVKGPYRPTEQKTDIVINDANYGIGQLFGDDCSSDIFFSTKPVRKLNRKDIGGLDLNLSIPAQDDVSQMSCKRQIPKKPQIKKPKRNELPNDEAFGMIEVNADDIAAFEGIKQWLPVYEKAGGDVPLYTLLNVLMNIRLINTIDKKITELVEHLKSLGSKKLNPGCRLSLENLIGEMLHGVAPYEEPCGKHDYATIGAYCIPMEYFYRYNARRLLTIEIDNRCGYLNVCFSQYQLSVWLHKVKSIVLHMICLYNLVLSNSKTPCDELLVKIEPRFENIATEWRNYQQATVTALQKKI